MTTIIRITEKNARKHAALEAHREPDRLEPTQEMATMHQSCGARSARKRLGSMSHPEVNPVHRSNCAIVRYRTQSGAIVEQDMRPLDINDFQKKQVEGAKVKEAIRFRINVITAKAPFVLKRQDKAVVKRMASLLVVDKVPQQELINHNPYKNEDYQGLWVMWSDLVSKMQFKTLLCA